MKSEPLVTVVIFAVGLTMGYLAGAGKGLPQTVNVPSNYDPARAVCADALKIAESRADSCWNALVDKIEKTRDITH